MTTQNIVPFLFEGESLVRVADVDGAPWFVAADVCAVLGIVKHRDAVARLQDDETRPVIVDGNAGPREMTAVSESGLYALIIRSRKPSAVKFRRWVTGEVLPSIRKTGRYAADDAAKIEAPPTPREFPNWSPEEWRLKLATANVYDRGYGKLAMQWIMRTKLGFPVPPRSILTAAQQMEMFEDEAMGPNGAFSEGEAGNA